MPRIIFVDIDGPMIPSSMYLFNKGADRERDFSSVSVRALRMFCELTSAKIVFNSYHNYDTSVHYSGGQVMTMGENLKQAALRNGIHSNDLHSSWRTQFGNFGKNTLDRKEAILLWLNEHPDITDWIVIDDTKIESLVESGRQILVDFDYGFTVKELNEALKRFNARPFLPKSS